MVETNKDNIDLFSMTGLSSIAKINDKLYLGSIFGLDTGNNPLKRIGIVDVLSCCPTGFSGVETFNRKMFPIEDKNEENIYKYFQEAIEFIDKSKSVFVHCEAGISRSASFVIAYLMWKEKLSFDNAMLKVKESRSFIWPNDGFVVQLKEFEKQLIANKHNLNKINFKKDISSLIKKIPEK